jgi:hypothetical protein
MPIAVGTPAVTDDGWAGEQRVAARKKSFSNSIWKSEEFRRGKWFGTPIRN